MKCEEHPNAKPIVVSLDKRIRHTVYENTDITIMPWGHFLEALWRGDII